MRRGVEPSGVELQRISHAITGEEFVREVLLGWRAALRRNRRHSLEVVMTCAGQPVEVLTREEDGIWRWKP